MKIEIFFLKKKAAFIKVIFLYNSKMVILVLWDVTLCR